MKLYVAGPMTGYPDFNYPAFAEASAALREMGHAVLSPHEAFGGDQSLPMPDYARCDLAYLQQVEGVVLLPGWQTSVGATTEVVVGLWLGLRFWGLEEGALVEESPTHPTLLFRETAKAAALSLAGVET